jgi:hypothetical protein
MLWLGEGRALVHFVNDTVGMKQLTEKTSYRNVVNKHGENMQAVWVWSLRHLPSQLFYVYIFNDDILIRFLIVYFLQVV